MDDLRSRPGVDGRGAADPCRVPSDQADIALPRAVWWFNGNEPVPGRLAVARGQLLFLERSRSGVEAPYDLGYERVSGVSLVERTRISGPMISLQLHDGTVEYFSIATSESGKTDSACTRTAFEPIDTRVRAKAAR